jgi:hypothetical protein
MGKQPLDSVLTIAADIHHVHLAAAGKNGATAQGQWGRT